MKQTPVEHYKTAKEKLDYNPETGEIRWKKDVKGLRNVKPGEIAGTVGTLGYRQIRIAPKKLLAHRIAWFIVHGYLPEHDIDHINRVKDDNRIENLREVTRQCNMRNCDVRNDNTSGVVGVCWYKKCGKWTAQITTNHKRKHLGLFYNFEDAVQARWEAEVKHNFPNCNTTSSAYLYLQEHANE